MIRHRLGRGSAKPVLLLVVGLVALSGCAASPDDSVPAPSRHGELEAAPGWVEPGWMTQVRQDDEQYQTASIACYAEYGLTAVKSIGGGSVGFLDLADETGQVPPAVEAVLDEASADCNERVPLPEHHASTADDAAYARMIDLRECIVAYGYDVPEAPSAATWKDSSLSNIWNPYSAMFADGSSLPQAELRSLMAACPQSGPGYYVEAPIDEG